MLSRLSADLTQRQAAGLYRRRRIVSGPQAPVLQTDEGELLSFCSNDYLGLAADPRLVAALTQAAQRYGVGTGAAHLISGHTAAHQALEEALADFVGTERALLFSTGYMANLGVLTALARPGDLILFVRWGAFECRPATALSSSGHGPFTAPAGTHHWSLPDRQRWRV